MRTAYLFLTFFFMSLGADSQSTASSGAYPPAGTGPSALPAAPPRILTGADQLDQYLPLLQGQSVAVFANATSVIGNTHLVDTLVRLGIHIRKIFSPEHGFRGDADAGATVGNATDPATGIPVISLYGKKTKPSPDDLAGVDVLLFDVQDVGVRFYTYIASMQRFLEAAIENNRPLIILDRPDPNGFYVDGPILDTKFRSFVGMQPIPVVYGMTIGEYAHMLVGEQWLDPAVTNQLNTIHAINQSADRIDSLMRALRKRPVNIRLNDFRLIVIPCRNYTHKSRYTLPVRPSPNLPNMQSVYLYPSLCLFEGTSVSLGRGTPKPFQQFGNPSFPPDGYTFTPVDTFGAHNPPLVGQLCNGFDLSQINVAKETGNRFSLKWIIKAYSLFPDKTHFFRGNGSTFDRLAGTAILEEQIRQGLTEEEIRKSWEPALSNFKKIRKKYLLYAD
ncbi:MAG TPA: DUF1343 domain-containing protein [Puia sp.]|jgi:uncharacterized protein YbbC (DUF1343 family)|nr:DUF1343 domain-containing protein [Puia sp.]